MKTDIPDSVGDDANETPHVPKELEDEKEAAVEDKVETEEGELRLRRSADEADDGKKKPSIIASGAAGLSNFLFLYSFSFL